MHINSSLALSHVIACLAIFFITSLSLTNANAIPPWALRSTRESLQDNEVLTATILNHLDARDDFQNSTNEGVPSLNDRSLLEGSSCTPTGGGNEPVVYQCGAEPLTVDDCGDKIRDWGKVTAGTSMFYTKFGGAEGIQAPGADAIKACKQYFMCNPVDRPLVTWDEIVDNVWFMAQARAFREGIQDDLTYTTTTRRWQKRLSQAFAQEANGVAYLCTPGNQAPDNNFPTDSTWGGWEWPTLTRNPNIDKIIRVDPFTSIVSEIWARGQPPTANEPQG